MTSVKPDEVQRTLLITGGELARTAGETFAALLANRQGPEPAITAIHCANGAADDDFLMAVTEALKAISPTDLGARLAQKEWRLAAVDEISLILALDVNLDNSRAAAALLEATTAVIHQYLGLETASLLIWLAGAESDTAVSACLSAPVPVTRAILPLGLRNEAGLRLPDDNALVAIAAELLWALAATPLRTLPEWAVAESGTAFTGDTAVLTLGLAGWEWSPTMTQAAFVHRWLETVLAYWLATADQAESPEQAAAWMQTNGLSPGAFAACALKEEESRLPDFLTAAWHAPLPWQLRHLFTEMRFQAEADTEACRQWGEYACLRLDEPLQQAKATLCSQAQSALDRQPVAGIARVTGWLVEILDQCDFRLGQMLDEAETQGETDAMLAAERGRLTASLETWLAAWPLPHWQTWLGAGWRFWRWPRLAWRYWQIVQSGRQLSHVLAQQAARQRQTIVHTAVRQAWIELEKIIRRLQSQVEEIGEMLHYLAGEITTPQSDPLDLHSAIPNPSAGSGQVPQFAISHLPLPNDLYAHLVPDDQIEAVVAAAAVGGLGKQVKQLDDAIIVPLRRLGAERLVGLWKFTAVDALAACLQNHDQVQQWWEQEQDAARPLWRLDETRLDETARTQNGRLTFVCGADAPLVADLLPEQRDQIRPLPSNDQERMLLACVRTGLTVEAMLGAVRGDDNER